MGTPTTDRWERVKALFDLALSQEPVSRAAFLASVCADDDIRREVERLLECHQQSGDFLDALPLQNILTPGQMLLDLGQHKSAAVSQDAEAAQPLDRETNAPPKNNKHADIEDAMINRRIGAYKLVRRIGSGGMASVYFAVRADDEYQKHVAVKLIRPELDSTELMTRFRSERQTLAALDHPNIVRLLDGGTTEDGLPYLVMEHVEGIPVDTYCDQQRLSIDQRLRLFVKVCSAVQHAHEKRVIHRDLKPSNILVTNDCNPVLLDFGIAKVLHPDEASETFAVTQTNMRRMTPAYASPEQVRGEKVSVATDVYSLGVVLYELLTGHRPYKLKHTTPAEIERAICEQDPENPSTAVDRIVTDVASDGTNVSRTPETVSRTREGHPEKLRRRLRGDLDTIVLAALRKEPQRRYQSVEELSADIRRHLEHLPIRTRRSTPTYRVSKFVLRHKTETVAVAVMLGAIFAATSYSALQRRDRDLASRDAASHGVHVRHSVAVLGFKNLSGRPDTAWLSTALAEMLITELSAGGKLRAISGETVAQTKLNLSLPDTDALSKENLNLVYKNLGSDFVVLGSYLNMGADSPDIRLDVRVQDASTLETTATLAVSGKITAVPDLVTRAGADIRTKLGMDLISATESAKLQASVSTNPEAMRLYAEGLAKLRVFDLLAAKDLLNRAIQADKSYALAHSALATAWSGLGYVEKEKEEAKAAFDLSRELTREDSLLIEGRYRRANNEWDKTIDIYKALVSFFPDNLDHGLALAAAEVDAGKGKDALATLQNLRKLPYPSGNDPRIDLQEAEAAAAVSDFKRQSSVAEQGAQKADANGAKLLAAECLVSEGRGLQDLGAPDKANAVLQRALARFVAAGDQFGRARALHGIGLVAYHSSHLAEARSAFGEALKIQQLLGNRLNQAKLWNDIGNLRDTEGDPDGKESADKTALAIYRETGNLQGIATELGNLGIVEGERGKNANAKRYFEEALRLDRELGDQNSTAYDLGNLAEILKGEGEFPTAQKDLEESIAISRHTGQKRALAFALFNLAAVRTYLGDLDAAEQLFTESRQVFKNAGNRLGESGPISALGSIRLLRGDLAGARSLQEESRATREAIGASASTAENRQSIAEISLEEGKAVEAETTLHTVIKEYRDVEDPIDASNAQALLVYSLLAQGKRDEAEKTAREGMNLAAESGDREAKILAAVADARVRTAARRPLEAIERLRTVLSEARKLGILATQFEVRLAMGEAQMKAGNWTLANAELSSLEHDAKKRGFYLTARKVAAIQQSRRGGS
jgi:serine/threonine protein kinase/tetratricopeptide (TPR) repeat protein